MKLTLTRVGRKKVTTKFGEKVKVAVKAKEYGDQWISGFDNPIAKGWEAGQVVEVGVERKGDQGQYLNLVFPKKQFNNAPDPKIDEILRLVKEIHASQNVGSKVPIAREELAPDEDVPF